MAKDGTNKGELKKLNEKSAQTSYKYEKMKK
jgi:hypothetical protein